MLTKQTEPSKNPKEQQKSSTTHWMNRVANVSKIASLPWDQQKLIRDKFNGISWKATRSSQHPIGRARQSGQYGSLAPSFLVEVMDHFAELLVADLAVSIFVYHSYELVYLIQL
jgi:hypothetical protein